MSKKKVDEKRMRAQKKRPLYIAICAVAFVVVFGFLAGAWYLGIQAEDTPMAWSIDNSTGKLVFGDRGASDASSTLVETGTNYTLEKIVYKSNGADIYAFLRKPTNVTKPPVVVVLPALTMTKEMDSDMAKALCSMGYASLTLDTRGFGETGGTMENDWQSGYNSFINGSNPVQYEQIYDALRGLDYVKTRSDLDTGDVAILGESIGGMWAVIAGAEEPQFKGVVTISASDFNTSGITSSMQLEFLNSTTPSRYVSSLPPRKLAMFQFDRDPTVPMGDGKALYDKAEEPKAWHQYNGTTHGVYDSVYEADLHTELKGMLGR